MLSPMTRSEMRIFVTGIAVLVLVVILGVAAAENQLNKLTQSQDFVEAFNIIRSENNGTYSAYFLGNSCSMAGVYKLGRLTNTGQALVLEAGGTRLAVPTMIYYDMSQAVYWLELWRSQFIAEAFKAKLQLAGYLTELRPILQNFINSIKAMR